MTVASKKHEDQAAVVQPPDNIDLSAPPVPAVERIRYQQAVANEVDAAYDPLAIGRFFDQRDKGGAEVERSVTLPDGTVISQGSG